MKKQLLTILLFAMIITLAACGGGDSGATKGTAIKLSLNKPRNTLPVNDQNIAYFSGTPFMMEAAIQVRDVLGNLTNPNGGVVNVSINPVESMYFSTLDDPETEEVNEFFQTLGQAPIDVVAGTATIFLWSGDIPGTATISITATEAGGSGRVSSSTFTVDVVNGGINPKRATRLSISDTGGSLYINGSGGQTGLNTSIAVFSGNIPIQDSEFNNVQLSMTTARANSGEKLLGTDISGATVEGASINIATVNGVANAAIISGLVTNTITLTATVDKADNNIENGIQEALTATSTYEVSDGVLWALELVTPALDSLTVNGDFALDADGNPILNNGFVQYNFQDGTYSLIISAIGTDKAGNPALPQTLQFGMINSPLSGYPHEGSGFFVHSDFDGNPQEGGANFTSTSGDFITAAGGVQPADTLVVFGEESLGNEDLESAVTVANVNSETSLTIVERFNRNDESGSIHNDFGILPYAIGRAVDGNILATATLNANGVATTTLNYPVSQLGRLAAVSVVGRGGNNNGVIKSVTDVELMTFPGVEGFRGNLSTLTVSPNVIPANISAGFIVCLADSARNPLPGRLVSFSYQGIGSGTIDGQTGVGTMTNATGLNGCTTGIASTTGIVGISDDSGFNFSSGGLTCRDAAGVALGICLRVVSAAGGILNANPSSFIGSGIVDIELTLFDGSGNTVEGAPISGECSQVTGGSLSIIFGPTVTNSDGISFVRVVVDIDAPGGGLDGTCTFSTASGEPSVIVNFSGRDSCLIPNPSPAPPLGACTILQFQVSGTVIGMTTAGPIILQNNGVDDVTLTSNGAFSFPLQDDGTIYAVTVSTPPPGQTCTVAPALGLGTISGANATVTVTCM